MRYEGEPDFRHDEIPRLGVLMANLGTPAAPTPAALRRYLGEFLADPRVVELPRPLWRLILHGVILRLRPRRSARGYAKVWTDDGAPLLTIARRQQAALQQALDARLPGPVHVALAMRYGEPSVRRALDELRAAHARRILVLPLYPQYSGSTVGSTFDAVSAVLQHWRWVPELRLVTHYHDQAGYIEALAQRIRAHWDEHGRGQRLIFSFHGIPQRYFLAGDPYYCQCQKTARLVAERLGLSDDAWSVAFQSRFGREPWLQPYTDHVLGALPGEGIKRVDVICPGFSADCLETLEEIDHQNRELFIDAGGERFHYIPALNDQPAHMDALAGLVEQHCQGWPEASAEWSHERVESAAQMSQRRAIAQGAKG